jgi:hypothetical protein
VYGSFGRFQFSHHHRRRTGRHLGITIEIQSKSINTIARRGRIRSVTSITIEAVARTAAVSSSDLDVSRMKFMLLLSFVALHPVLVAVHGDSSDHTRQDEIGPTFLVATSIVGSIGR